MSVAPLDRRLVEVRSDEIDEALVDLVRDSRVCVGRRRRRAEDGDAGSRGGRNAGLEKLELMSPGDVVEIGVGAGQGVAEIGARRLPASR